MTSPVTGTTDIDFLRSTTTTVVNREADGDTTTRVEHLARFGVRPGSLIDMLVPYGRRKRGFQPQWMEATWSQGRLVEVKLSGPQRLTSSDLSESVTAHRYFLRTRDGGFNRDDLPQTASHAIANYERAVAMGGNA